MESKLMLLRCAKCGTVWNYKGNKIYATCPSCLTKVKVQKFKIIPEDVFATLPSLAEKTKLLADILMKLSPMKDELSDGELRWIAAFNKTVSEGLNLDAITKNTHGVMTLEKGYHLPAYAKKAKVVYSNEREAYNHITSELKSPQVRQIDIVAVAATSVVELFDDYKNALMDGKNLTVWTLDPKASNQWPFFTKKSERELVAHVRERYSTLLSRRAFYDPNRFSVLSLRCLVEGTIETWNDIAEEVKAEAKHPFGRLELIPYRGRPYWKCWIFDCTKGFVGEYDLSQPDKGMDVPIYLIDDQQFLSEITEIMVHHLLPQKKRRAL
jgi:predicted  nucleic acid-binding Zn-ribbon protein